MKKRPLINISIDSSNATPLGLEWRCMGIWLIICVVFLIVLAMNDAGAYDYDDRNYLLIWSPITIGTFYFILRIIVSILSGQVKRLRMKFIIENVQKKHFNINGENTFVESNPEDINQNRVLHRNVSDLESLIDEEISKLESYFEA